MREPVEIRLTAKTPEAVRLLLDTLINVEGSAATASIGHPSPGRKAGYLAYSADFDEVMVGNGIRSAMHDGDDRWDSPGRTAARAWTKTMRWECLMEVYAVVAGEWSDYFRSYKWQPLGGGHRAMGDCRAALDLLLRMAQPGATGGDPPSEDDEDEEL